jgi:two-component system NarL family response regulator
LCKDDDVAGPKGGGTTVLVAHYHRAFAEAVTLAVGVEPGFHLLDIATTAKDALCSFEADPPDVALVAPTLPDADGLDLIAQIKKHYPATRVVAMTGYESPARLVSVAEAGADDFLSENVSVADLLGALREQAGQSLASQRDRSPNELGTRSRSAEAPELTPLEREVLDHIGQGQPAQRITQDLGISISTYRASLRAIYTKLDAHSQLAAVTQAARLRLL